MITLPPAVPRPCSDCPWRRVAAPGWLGPYPPERWLAIAHGEQPVACHQTIRRRDVDWDDDKLRQCAGMAIYRNNVCKSPHNEQDAVHVFEADERTVFASDAEFMAYHGPTWRRLYAQSMEERE